MMGLLVGMRFYCIGYGLVVGLGMGMGLIWLVGMWEAGSEMFVGAAGWSTTRVILSWESVESFMISN